MLRKLVSRFRDRASLHPLGSERALDETLAELRHAEPEWELLDLIQWLEVVPEAGEELDAAAAARAVQRLDEYAQTPLAAVWTAYFEPQGRLAGSDKAWNTLANYGRAAWGAYRHCFAQAEAGGGDPRAMALFAMRAMRAWVMLKKLGRLRYRAADASWWQQAHALLAAARGRGLTQMPLVAYPGEAEGTLWREYLVGVYLELAPVDSLEPPLIELVDRLLRQLANCLVCRDRALADERWCLDVADASGPFRRDPARNYGPTVGVLGFDMLRGGLLRLIADLRREKSGSPMPVWAKTTFCSREQLQQLLLALVTQWSGKPPERRDARADADGELIATFGFPLLRRLVSCSALARSGRRIDYDSYLARQREHRFGYAERVEAQLVAADDAIPEDPLQRLQKLELVGEKQMMEPWRLKDFSPGGLGVYLPALQARHVIGALVGFRFVDQVDWHAGLIRRLRRDPQGRMTAGIQWLPGPPLCAQVRLMKIVERGPWEDVVEVSGHGLTDAVLLERRAHQILVPAGFYRPEEPIRIVVGDERIDARMADRLAAGEGFELVSYRLLHPAHAAELAGGDPPAR